MYKEEVSLLLSAVLYKEGCVCSRRVVYLVTKVFACMHMCSRRSGMESRNVIR